MKITHDTIIGTGLVNTFINLMRLHGWLPVKEYFSLRKNGIELDWVMVLTIENDGFIGIPDIAEYVAGDKPGWYNKSDRRIDDWTNVIMFKPIEGKDTADDIRNKLLDDAEEKENIENIPDCEDAFTETLISSCGANCVKQVNNFEFFKNLSMFN